MSEPKEDELLAALMDLFGRIAHDLRGPAGITSGVLDELASRDTSGADAALFAMARRGLASVLRIADRLEMVAQLEVGPRTIDRAPLDFSELVLRAADDAKIIQKRKAITVTCDVPTSLKAAADRRWLAPAIAELIANAIRYAKAQVRVVATVSGGRARVVVEDDGRGFSDEALAALAGPRFARSNARAGLGLSLSIARDVARAHGGDLSISKSPNGARVEIDISER